MTGMTGKYDAGQMKPALDAAREVAVKEGTMSPTGATLKALTTAHAQ